MHKIAVFRALYLGDFLCSVPAFRALRKAFPDSEISLIGLAEMKDLAKRYNNYIDDFISFPGYPLLTDRPFDSEKFQTFLEAVRNKEFNLILQMQGNGSIINNLLKAFNAKRIVGFCQTKKEENKNFLLYPSNLHEIERHLALLKHIGISSDGKNIDFPIKEEDNDNYNKAALNINRDYVCLHPGSKAAWRQWPIQHFAAIGDYLGEKGFQLVITGSKPEIDLANNLAGLMSSNPIISTGKLSLGGTAVLLAGASFLLTNCTGISHLAAALKTPSLVISMDGEPNRWAPLNRDLHRTIDWKANPDYNVVFKEIESISLIELHTSSGEG